MSCPPAVTLVITLALPSCKRSRPRELARRSTRWQHTRWQAGPGLRGRLLQRPPASRHAHQRRMCASICRRSGVCRGVQQTAGVSMSASATASVIAAGRRHAPFARGRQRRLAWGHASACRYAPRFVRRPRSQIQLLSRQSSCAPAPAASGCVRGSAEPARVLPTAQPCCLLPEHCCCRLLTGRQQCRHHPRPCCPGKLLRTRSCELQSCGHAMVRPDPAHAPAFSALPGPDTSILQATKTTAEQNYRRRWPQTAAPTPTLRELSAFRRVRRSRKASRASSSAADGHAWSPQQAKILIKVPRT